MSQTLRALTFHSLEIFPKGIESGQSALIDIDYLPTDVGYHLADVGDFNLY